MAATTTRPAPPATASRRRTLHERQIFSARAIREARHGRERLRRLGKRARMTAPRPKIDPSLLEERLGALPGLDRLREAAAGLGAYLVGGSVRDLLLGRERADIDVTVEGDGVHELARRLGGAVRTNERFATATVLTDGHEIDLAASRAETYARPGALPEVTPAPLMEDLARRDFTVNAMAVPLAGAPELIDPHGG